MRTRSSKTPRPSGWRRSSETLRLFRLNVSKKRDDSPSWYGGTRRETFGERLRRDPDRDPAVAERRRAPDRDSRAATDPERRPARLRRRRLDRDAREREEPPFVGGRPLGEQGPQRAHGVVGARAS